MSDMTNRPIGAGPKRMPWDEGELEREGVSPKELKKLYDKIVTSDLIDRYESQLRRTGLKYEGEPLVNLKTLLNYKNQLRRAGLE